jgi:hypothetical protein
LWKRFHQVGDDEGSYDAVVKRLGITVAFAFDRGFEQMPGTTRVPIEWKLV